jgi:hypothetical protein
MKLRLLALAATAATALAASSANATVISAHFDPLAWALNAGETDITQFEGGPTLGATTFFQPGYTITGGAQLFTGSVDSLSAAPALPSTASVYNPSTQRDGSQYLSIQAGQTATITFAGGLTEISFYAGSFDGYNTLAFQYADGTFELPVMTGDWVTQNTIAQSNGDQQNGNSNGRLTLTFDKAITSVTLGSTNTNAFEISDVAGIAAAGVPEPASWALMILGFGGAGAMLRTQRRQTVATTA